MRKIFTPAALIVLAAFSSCKEKIEKPDFLVANIDSSIKPGDDFFMYANNGWFKKNAIPEEEASWGIGNLVDNEIYDRLKKINEKTVGEKNAAGTVAQKIGDFWHSGMDTAAVDQQGITPLKPVFDEINSLKTINDVVKEAAILHKRGIDVLFNNYVAQDDKNSEAMAFIITQGGLGMPSRDYYFDTDSKTVSVRNAYKKYLFLTLKQTTNDSAAAAKSSAMVYALEEHLAKASRKLADLRDPYKNYNKLKKDELQKLMPDFDLTNYLQIMGVSKVDSVIVGQPEFLTAVNAELKASSLDAWKSYITFHSIMQNASFLDNTTFTNYFNYRKTISGVEKPRPRWKRVLDAEQSVMGEALGQLFVKEYFNEKAKKRYSDLVEAIRDAYKDRIKNLAWMSDETKKKAIDKLTSITKKVGYPDKWKDFSAMKIENTAYVTNMMNANEWWFNYNINKLGKPVDRTEWDMSPQTYNAYYNPSNNEIVLPAGMFAVPGMKDEDLDDAFVYGYAAASTIGHEITHGFDDQGRQYDAKGNLQGWWQPNDSVQFVHRAANIIRQFNEFVPVDTLHVNGEATQGENIADLGGMLLGLDAFKKTELYKKGEKIHGYTPVQRYFLGYAYSWMYHERKEKLASQVKTNVHAPAKERVNGPVVNVPEFYEAFGIKKGDKMYRADSLRVNIW